MDQSICSDTIYYDFSTILTCTWADALIHSGTTSFNKSDWFGSIRDLAQRTNFRNNYIILFWFQVFTDGLFSTMGKIILQGKIGKYFSNSSEQRRGISSKNTTTLITTIYHQETYLLIDVFSLTAFEAKKKLVDSLKNILYFILSFFWLSAYNDSARS